MLNRVEFSSWVVELSFSIRLECSDSTSQFNSTLFQKNFNSTQHFLSRVLNSMWSVYFNMKTEMKNLKTELKSYNLELKLIINSIWLSKSENQSWNKHASMILTFRIKAEVQRHLKKWLLAARSTYQTVDYRDYWSNNQCQKCQTFKHLQNKCNKSSKCLYFKRNHQIWNHKYQLSTCKDK